VIAGKYVLPHVGSIKKTDKAR